MTGLRITKLCRHPEGYWQCNVSVNGTTQAVDRKYGSWQGTANGRRSDVRFEIAIEIQRQVHTLEGRERRAQKAATA